MTSKRSAAIFLSMSKKLKTMTAARARKTLAKLLPKRTVAVTVVEWSHSANMVEGDRYNRTHLSVSVLPGFTGSPCDGYDQDSETVDFSLLVARVAADAKLHNA